MLWLCHGSDPTGLLLAAATPLHGRRCNAMKIPQRKKRWLVAGCRWRRRARLIFDIAVERLRFAVTPKQGKLLHCCGVQQGKGQGKPEAKSYRAVSVAGADNHVPGETITTQAGVKISESRYTCPVDKIGCTCCCTCTNRVLLYKYLLCVVWSSLIAEYGSTG